MVDTDRIQERLELLGGYLAELRRLRDQPLAVYLDRDVYAGRYLVQVAAQTCIDLANHVTASEGWRAPRNFGDAFTVLSEHGVVDDGLAGRLRGLAGLRNRLVHVYDLHHRDRRARERRRLTLGRSCAVGGRCYGRDSTWLRLGFRPPPAITPQPGWPGDRTERRQVRP